MTPEPQNDEAPAQQNRLCADACQMMHIRQSRGDGGVLAEDSEPRPRDVAPMQQHSRLWVAALRGPAVHVGRGIGSLKSSAAMHAGAHIARVKGSAAELAGRHIDSLKSSIARTCALASTCQFTVQARCIEALCDARARARGLRQAILEKVLPSVFFLYHQRELEGTLFSDRFSEHYQHISTHFLRCSAVFLRSL